MTLPVVVIGVSHKTAPVEVREKFAAGAEILPELLARLTSRPELDEAMFLSTCNRVEVIGLPKNKGAFDRKLLYLRSICVLSVNYPKYPLIGKRWKK